MESAAARQLLRQLLGARGGGTEQREVDAAEATADAVGRINGDGGVGILDGFEKRLKEKMKLVGKVSGSPRFDVYGADFGWGEMEMFEALHIDCDESVSLEELRSACQWHGCFSHAFHQGLIQLPLHIHMCV
ncbi:phenolic glucoside malonyltransferase 1-like [Salvia miltiorrhiza]|uniref:phenolic glucoside malonyltransferase 1-like n=1 Tax=Salvia miltiorrhiza TaxID=226208 RepID=UPI0025AD237A|nr:phenolic glucoside malonyltransferase 1-like [Salvia miltiorrhiza]